MVMNKQDFIDKLIPSMQRDDALASIKAGLIRMVETGSFETGWDTLSYYTANADCLTDEDKRRLTNLVKTIKKEGWLKDAELVEDSDAEVEVEEAEIAADEKEKDDSFTSDADIFTIKEELQARVRLNKETSNETTLKAYEMYIDCINNPLKTKLSKIIDYMKISKDEMREEDVSYLKSLYDLMYRNIDLWMGNYGDRRIG